MATITNTVYRLKHSPHPQKNSLAKETLSTTEWNSQYSDYAVLAIRNTDGDLCDISEWVQEIQIDHESYDSDKSGREQKRGAPMVRKWLGDKHKLQVKLLDRVPQSVMNYIFSLIDTQKIGNHDRVSFDVTYQSPCTDKLWTQEYYCATIHFGAQRYDKQDKTCYYYGVNFNLIEM